MRDFVAALEQQLLEASRQEQQRIQDRAADASRARLGWASTHRRGLALACVAAVASVVAVVLQTGPSATKAEALPVLSRPATDASGLSIATQLRRHGADLRHARAFSAPAGSSYVIPTPDGACLALADPLGGYGQSCATSREITERGLPVAIVPPDGANAVAQFAVVLPVGASDVLMRDDKGQTTALAVVDGVASTTVPRGASITYSISGAEQRISVPAHVPSTEPQISCDGAHGHYLVTGPGSDPTDCG